MCRKAAVLCSMTLVVFFLAWTSPAGAQDARAQHEKDKQKGLLGSWSVTVTPTATSVCGGPALPSPPPFTELVTFSGRGGFQETNTQLNWNVKPLFPGVLGSASARPYQGNGGFFINSHGTILMVDPLLEGFDMPLLIRDGSAVKEMIG
jgi:hypothetical protein